MPVYLDLNWQHQLCKNPRPNPDIKTLFVDHNCGQQNGARPAQPANNFMGAFSKSTPFPPSVAPLTPFQPSSTSSASAPSLAGWMANPAPVTHPALSAGPVGLGSAANPAALVKRPRTPPVNTPPVDYQSADSEHLLKRPRPGGQPGEEVSYHGTNHLQCLYSQDDLLKTVAQTLNQGSSIMSMDFHPVQQTVLLVSTVVGDIAIWEVGSRERLAIRNFKVWDLGGCTTLMQAALLKEPGVSVNRVVWSPDGTLFGVAYSKHIVHTYNYYGGGDVRQHLEDSFTLLIVKELCLYKFGENQGLF